MKTLHPIRFAADRMLGKLAKWLRILGYDTFYVRALADDEFVKLAAGGRVLLSRNRRLRKRIAEGRLVFIQANDPEAQLQELVRFLNLEVNPDNFFTRCLVCNSALEPAKTEEVAGKVPDHVLTDYDQFSICGSCGRIYWPGSHLVRSREEIRRLLGV